MPEAPQAKPLQILHLEDSVVDHNLVCLNLQRTGMPFSIQRVETLEEFARQFDRAPHDIVLADYRLPGFTALDAWEHARRQPRQVPFVLLSGAIGESAAVAAIKLGVSDYLRKDELTRLPHVIERAIEFHRTRMAKEQADRELAISQVQLASFAAHLQTTIEQERAAISREIHDDIGGSLAAAKFDLAWIGRHNPDPATQEHVRLATEMLQHAIGASQRIMMNLRPAILDQGLSASIHWLGSGFERRTGIKTAIHLRETGLEIPKPLQLVAYRTAQEALTNIGKYAQCDTVRIEMSDTGSTLTLEIADNGRGLRAGDRDKPTAFGLRGLAERAKAVGGWLDISSRPGAGCSITLTVPLAAHASAVNQESFT